VLDFEKKKGGKMAKKGYAPEQIIKMIKYNKLFNINGRGSKIVIHIHFVPAYIFQGNSSWYSSSKSAS